MTGPACRHVRRWTILALAAALLPCAAAADVSPELYARLARMVLRVDAIGIGSTVASGSAVQIGPDRVVTNCHVTRNATTIDVVRNGIRHGVQSLAQDVERDLCLLVVPGLDGDGVERSSSGRLTLGEAVISAGYPNRSRLKVQEGRVTGLYRYGDGRLIQNSALFDDGESGGGLFDRDGRLVGFLTFRNAAGGSYHFALPAEWSRDLEQRPVSKSTAPGKLKALWEGRDDGARPAVLEALALEAAGQWSSVVERTRGWADQEPDNPEPWVVAGRSLRRLQRDDDAAAAFRRALAIDERCAEAWYGLGLLYRERGDGSGLDDARRALIGLNPLLEQELRSAAGCVRC